MKDRILRNFLSDFADEIGVPVDDEPALFERFSAYCALMPHLAEHFDVEDVLVAGGQDTAIDAIAVIVNDRLISNVDEFNDLLKHARRLSVTFVFVQAKTSPKFGMAEIGNFLFGVSEFFSEDPTLPANDDVLNLRDVSDAIFGSSLRFAENPRCELYYVTSGTWAADRNVTARVDKGVKSLRDTGLFASVRFSPLDSALLQERYRAFRRSVETEVDFALHAIVPQIQGVIEAYIGLLPVSEFLKLVVDDSGQLRRTLFYDNIRDFQGDSAVNNEINDTLASLQEQAQLPLLNNGVTLVAYEAKKTGTRFRLADYQIVNGCQTTHLIYRNRRNILPEVVLPIKVIVTRDPDVTNRIIRATNRQTEIKPEAFAALTEFHKRLEDYYDAMRREHPLQIYYERRNRQFHDSDIKKYQIVTLSSQLTAFVAVFLKEPHSCHRYYGELLNSYESRLFQEGHKHSAYYLSAALLFRLEGMFRQGKVPSYLRRLRHQMAMLFMHRAGGPNVPSPSSSKVDAHCEKVLRLLVDNVEAARMWNRVSEDVKVALQEFGSPAGQAARTKAFTTRLLS